MKKTLFGAVAALLTVAAAPAMAQDFTGPRIGVTGGYDDVQSREGFTYGVVAGVDPKRARHFSGSLSAAGAASAAAAGSSASGSGSPARPRAIVPRTPLTNW